MHLVKMDTGDMWVIHREVRRNGPYDNPLYEGRYVDMYRGELALATLGPCDATELSPVVRVVLNSARIVHCIEFSEAAKAAYIERYGW